MTDEATPAITPTRNLPPAAVAAAVTGTPTAANTTPAPTATPATAPAATPDSALTQKTYEERIADIAKRETAMDAKLKRMETLNDKITAEGKATGGAPPAETAEQTQKKTIIKNFGGCIPNLEKII